MSHLTIGSSDVAKLLSGKSTKGYAELWEKFVDPFPPNWNSLASPIDAMRTGAILEPVYLKTLPQGYFYQVKKTHPELSVLISSLDFAKVKSGVVTDFEELKTIYLTDYISIVRPIAKMNKKDQAAAIKKEFKVIYKQVQFQMACTHLTEGTLTFLSVENYIDHENAMRVIEEKDVTKFVIPRDQKLINQIEERAKIFQDVKDHFKS